ALEADAQVDPAAAFGEALLAAVDGLGELGDVDVIEMGAGHQAFSWRMGSETWNVVRPGSDSNVSEPSWRSTTIRRAVARPSPVPAPTSLVVKNESNTWSR